MRDFNYPVKLVLFLSSYVPLFAIMGFKLWNFGPMLLPPTTIPQLGVTLGISYTTLCILIGCGLLTIVLYHIIGVHSGRATTQRPIDKYQKRNDLLATYLLVYVFVFAGLDITNPLDFVIFLVFFVMLGILQIRSGHLYVNPMLGARGYQVYEITSDDQVMLVISKGSIKEKTMDPHTAPSGDDTARTKLNLVALDTATFLAP